MQVHLTFTPPTSGPYFSDLELMYTSTGHTTLTSLSGVGQDLPVGLCQDTVTLLPTYVTKMSQKAFKVSVAAPWCDALGSVPVHCHSAAPSRDEDVSESVQGECCCSVV